MFTSCKYTTTNCSCSDHIICENARNLSQLLIENNAIGFFHTDIYGILSNARVLQIRVSFYVFTIEYC